MTLKISNLKLKNPLFLAPMVDVTDLPYRLLCRKFGCAMAYTEMLYIDSILHKNKKTSNLMKTSSQDKPIGLQITGNNEKEFENLLRIKELKNFDLIDINCGCPSIRITGNKAGSFLLKKPEKIGGMIKILKKSGKPVTAKIRLGFKRNNVMKVAKIIEKAGADALTVHARLAIHGRSVKADWLWLAKVKKNLKIPIIGNGDIFNGEDAKKMLKICDGVMLGRSAIGDPLIFKRILEYLEKKERLNNESKSELNNASSSINNNLNINSNLKLFEEYLKLQKKHYGKEVDIGRIKYVGASFLKGFEGAASYRAEFSRMKTIGEMKKLLKKVKEINFAD